MIRIFILSCYKLVLGKHGRHHTGDIGSRFTIRTTKTKLDAKKCIVTSNQTLRVMSFLGSFWLKLFTSGLQGRVSQWSVLGQPVPNDHKVSSFTMHTSLRSFPFPPGS